MLVLEHAGVCLPRQYRTFSGIAHGRETHRFFDKLIAGGFASTDLAAPAHAGRLYHLQYKPWYRLLGEPDHRHRRPMSVGRAVERLMVLDGVLAEPDITWLGLVRDKVTTFTTPLFCVPPDALPRTTVGGVVPFPGSFGHQGLECEFPCRNTNLSTDAVRFAFRVTSTRRQASTW